MEKQAGVFTTFCLKSRQLLLHTYITHVDRLTQRVESARIDGDTLTPWKMPEIMFATGHGPFPTYLKRFSIRNSDSCVCGNLGIDLYTMLQATCLQPHTT
ncbi:hypothetical protein AVEN_228232-1 [Araneus ventricosus]|uniref:Uncharacterized protein n=1 Tax=Araneus ventricosus TaxID=182803 RepID=A0A4Y2GE54_ARAVE|nr:hypothetical protein AVEN_228232-1 [Araneus ventricosus]